MGGFADGNSYLFVIAPEGDAAEDAFAVGDDADVFGGSEFDLLGVAAAEVEVVPVEGGLGLRDGFEEHFVPVLLAEAIEAAAADVVLVGEFLPR